MVVVLGFGLFALRVEVSSLWSESMPLLSVLCKSDQLFERGYLWYVLEHIGPVAFFELELDCHFGEPLSWVAKDVPQPFPFALTNPLNDVVCLCLSARFLVNRFPGYSGKTRCIGAVYAGLELGGKRPRLTSVC